MTITGVAPWAMMKSNPTNNSISSSTTNSSNGILPKHSGIQTSIQSSSSSSSSSISRFMPTSTTTVTSASIHDDDTTTDHLLAQAKNALSSTQTTPTTTTTIEGMISLTSNVIYKMNRLTYYVYYMILYIVNGYQQLRLYMERCYTEVFESSIDNNSIESLIAKKDWCFDQIAMKPKILTELKFHDLVFGQILGEGAFSIVKYARHITKVFSIVFQYLFLLL